MKISQITFKAWMKANLSEYLNDIVEHGVDAGYPHLTYYHDTSEIYAAFSKEIWEALNEDAEEFGYKNVFDMMRHWNRVDMASSEDSFQCLLVWYMAEKTAQMLTDE